MGAELVVEHLLVKEVYFAPNELHLILRAIDQHVLSQQFFVHRRSEQDLPLAIGHLII